MPGFANAEEALVTALGDAVSTAPERLDAFVADTYWPALHAAAAGTPLARPDVVVTPRTEEDVAEVVRIADAHGVPVVPWGGGSGTQGGCLPIHGGIVIDLRGLDEIIAIDERLHDGDGPGGRERAPARGRAEHARPHAAALPGLRRVGHGRGVYRGTRLRCAVHALRED